jgi:hypothetical protein
MAKIYNSDVTKGLAQNAGIQQNVDKTPNELAEKIVPTIETNPKLLRDAIVLATFSSDVSTGSTSEVLAASPSKDVYITGLTLTFYKDVTCDVTTSARGVSAVFGGAPRTVLSYMPITLTAEKIEKTIMFDPPLKIDRNTAITTTAFNYAAGSSQRRIIVFGYYVDSSNA